MKSVFVYLFAKYISYKNGFWKRNPVLAQEKTLKKLISQAKNTEFGKDHGFEKISSHKQWVKNVPIRDYEGIKKYIDRVVAGEHNVLWPKKPIYFCKTSGTTSGSKYIPISKESMPYHIKSARDAIFEYVLESGDTSILSGKMIFLQGSPVLSKTSGVLTGRLSGIVAHHIPFYLKKNRLPSYKTNCIEDWEKKVDAIVSETVDQNMTLISGIPPWVKMYFEKINKKRGVSIGEVFPGFKLFIYGGVNYAPYKRSFEKLIGRKIGSVELYPASEGFIAYQDSQKEKGLLLCVDNGIFYEFILLSDFIKNKYERIGLGRVVKGVDYVIILNTNAGLWGYNIGDTVRFVCLDPFRVVVSGRVGHFTSAFGEHVIAQEVEGSLEKAAESHFCSVLEFHVSPQINPNSGLPFHEWLIEFDEEPNDMSIFAETLDLNLQNKNTYYKDLIEGGVLRGLKIVVLKKGVFNHYMLSEGRLGGQNKPPRLANNRKVAEKIIKINEKQ